MRKIIFRLIVMVCIFWGVNVATAEARIVTNDPTVKSGEKVTINITSQEVVDGYKISVASNSGLTFSSVSGGEANGQVVAGSNASGTTSLATYTFKAPEVTTDTTYKVVFNAEGVILHGTTEKTSSSATATVTVKANTTNDKQEQNPDNTDKNKDKNNEENKAKEPSFKKASDTVYSTGNINVRKSYSTDSDILGTLSEGENVSRIGIGDNGWTKVSYNGSTGYIKTSLLSEKEPEKSANKALKTLELKQEGLEPAFNPETTSYTLNVESNVEKLDIKASPSDEKAKVEIIGNENLKEGDNLIKITVTAQDNTVRTYTINVKKGQVSELKLSSLVVSGYTLSPKFSANHYEYKLNILDPSITKIDVTAKSNNENAKVEVSGNTNLKEGNNTVQINVSSEDGTEKVTYKITVNKTPMVAGTTKNKSKGSKMYIGIIIAVIAIIALIVIIIKKRRNAIYEEDLSEEDEDFYGYKTSKMNYSNSDNVYTNSNNIVDHELFGELPQDNYSNNRYDSTDNIYSNIKKDTTYSQPEYASSIYNKEYSNIETPYNDVYKNINNVQTNAELDNDFKQTYGRTFNSETYNGIYDNENTNQTYNNDYNTTYNNLYGTEQPSYNRYQSTTDTTNYSNLYKENDISDTYSSYNNQTNYDNYADNTNSYTNSDKTTSYGSYGINNSSAYENYSGNNSTSYENNINEDYSKNNTDYKNSYEQNYNNINTTENQYGFSQYNNTENSFDNTNDIDDEEYTLDDNYKMKRTKGKHSI